MPMPDAGLPVYLGIDVEAFRAEGDARHVAQPDLRAVGQDLQQDIVELLRRCAAASPR